MAVVTAAVAAVGAVAVSAKSAADQKSQANKVRRAGAASAQQQVAGVQDAADLMLPATEEAAKIRMAAAQKAADLETVGLGAAKAIYQNIISGADDVLTAAQTKLSGMGGQGRSIFEGFKTAQADFKEQMDRGAATHGASFSKDVQGQSYEDAVAGGQEFMRNNGDTTVFEQGSEAFRMQLAMTGALGADAQQSFYDNYKNSPKVKYQLEQIQRMTGSGQTGGNRMRAMQELIAFNDDQYFAQLGEQSERGQRFREDESQRSLDRDRAGSDIALREAGLSANLASKQASLQAGDASTQLGLRSLQTQTGTNLARDLGDIEAEKLTSLAALEGESITGQANTLAAASQRGAELRAAGKVRGNETMIRGLGTFANAVGDGAFDSFGSGGQDLSIDYGSDKLDVGYQAGLGSGSTKYGF